jgi:hypothetical protein
MDMQNRSPFRRSSTTSLLPPRDEDASIPRFEVANPKRMEAGGSIQLVADVKASAPTARLTLSAVPSAYRVYPQSVPLNPGMNLVRVRVVIDGPPGRVTLVGRLGDLVKEENILVEAARRPR